MFDTMTMVKVLGGLFGSFLVFLLGGLASELIYAGEGHGDEEQAYVIPVADTSAPAEVVEEVPFEEIYAAADAAAGATAFARACGACHKVVEGENATGPSLYGVVGRTVDTAPGFAYSGALEEVVDVWTPDHINAFITAPATYAPGTKMNYGGMNNAETRADIIAYLDSLDG